MYTQKIDVQLCGCHFHVAEVVDIALALCVPELKPFEILLKVRAGQTFILRE